MRIFASVLRDAERLGRGGCVQLALRRTRLLVSVMKRGGEGGHPKAVLTVVLAVALLITYSVTRQPGSGTAFRWGAVPCELHRGRPLGSTEVARTVLGNHSACFNEPLDRELFPEKRVYAALMTYQFVHRDLMHFILNCSLLLVIGLSIETGRRSRLITLLSLRAFLLVLYLGSGVAGGLAIAALFPDSTSPIIGASASVAGLIGAYGVLRPPSRLLALDPRQVLLILGIGGSIISLVEQGAKVAVAHAGGLVFGMAAGAAWRYFRVA